MSRNAQPSGQFRLCPILQHEIRALASGARLSRSRRVSLSAICDLWQGNHNRGNSPAPARQPVDPAWQFGTNRRKRAPFVLHFCAQPLCFGISRHALRPAALRDTADGRAGPCPPDRGCARHGAWTRRDDVGDISLRAESDAHADPDPDPDTHGVTDPHADRDQLRPVGRQQCAQSWLQFPGAARQPGL